MGGAIYAAAGLITIDNVAFTANRAIGGNGGTVTVSWDGIWNGAAGGHASFGTGGGASAQYATGQAWGRPGGFGGGGGGGMHYAGDPTPGGNGGFGGGGGGGGGGAGDSGTKGIGGEFAGSGGRGIENGSSPTPDTNVSGGSGGGGAGLGGALFVKAATVTVTNSSFTNSHATGGTGGAFDTSVPGEDGQGVGGAIFVHQEGILNDYGNNTFSGNSAQTITPDIHMMEGAEYDTTAPVITGTF